MVLLAVYGKEVQRRRHHTPTNIPPICAQGGYQRKPAICGRLTPGIAQKAQVKPPLQERSHEGA